MNEKDLGIECITSFYERTIRRLWIIVLLLAVMLFASHAMWLYAWMQYDYVTETVDLDADGNGNASYVGNDGDINHVSTYIGEKNGAD